MAADPIRIGDKTIVTDVDYLVGLVESGGDKSVRLISRDSLIGNLEALTETLQESVDAINLTVRKNPVVIATVANIALASALVNGAVVNGATLVTGQRVLVRAQSLPQENGIYIVAASGAASRATDANTEAKMLGATTYVEGGADSSTPFSTWSCITNPITTLGTTPLTFVKVGSTDTSARSDLGTNPNGVGGAPTVFQHLTAIERDYASRPATINLYDPETSGTNDTYWDLTGGAQSGGGYENFSKTGKMAVTLGLPYLFTIAYAHPDFFITSEIIYWNPDGSFNSRLTSGAGYPVLSEGLRTALFAPIMTGFVSFNIGKLNANPTAHDSKALAYRTMLSVNSERVAWVPYARPYQLAALTKRSGLTVIKDGSVIYIRDKFTDQLDKIEHFIANVPLYGDYSQAGVAGPHWVALIGAGLPDTDVVSEMINPSDTLAITGDDQAPYWVNGSPIGANHGIPSASITATAHGKTNVDVGSRWTDGGGKVWVLTRILSANSLFVTPYPTGTATQWILGAPTTFTGTTLTHSASATHTGSITFSSPVYTDLLPLAQSQTVQIYLDGIELVADGIHKGDNLEIAQSYGIPNPRALLDALTVIAAAGGSSANPVYNPSTVQTQVSIRVTWSWKAGELCAVAYDWYNVQDYLQAQAAGIQVGPIYFAGDNLHLFVPKTTTEGTTGLNFTTAPQISGVNLDFSITSGEWSDSADPPERFAMIRKTSGGVAKRGCLFGYSHLVDRGIPANRVASTLTALLFAGAGAGNKAYPYIADAHLGAVATVDGHYSALCYRGYFDASDPHITSQGVYTWGIGQYWVFDTKETLTNVWVQPPAGVRSKLVGKKCIVTGNGKKSASLTFRSDFVTQQGVLISTSAGGGWFIAEIGR